MQSVLVLISNEAERAVTGEAVGVALETVPATTEPRWLNPAVACEIALDGAVEETVAARARDNLAKLAVDAAVLPARGRRKSVLLADMDSTIIGQECIDELGAMSGLGDRIANITTRAMRGELDFADALRERVGLMEGLPASAIEQALAERITLNQGARTLVRTMKQHGAYTALVSGGFTAFTSRIANEAGFDEHRGNELVLAGGTLTGRVVEPVLGRSAKVDAMREICARRGITPRDVIAVGDGANDLDMLAEAGMGVAIHAKQVVAEAARIRIDHGDLTALLYLQGYHVDEFAC